METEQETHFLTSLPTGGNLYLYMWPFVFFLPENLCPSLMMHWTGMEWCLHSALLCCDEESENRGPVDATISVTADCMV